MRENSSSRQDFKDASDRNFQELMELSKQLTEENQRYLTYLRQKEEKEIEQKKLDQQKRREQNIENEKAKIRKEARQLDNVPWWARKNRQTDARMRQLAERAVAANNKNELTAIREEYQKEIDKTLASEGLRRSKDSERETRENIKESFNEQNKSPSRAMDRFNEMQARGRDRDEGRERER